MKNLIISDQLYTNNEIIQKSTASIQSGRKFISWENTGNTVRSDYTRADYEYFRSGNMPRNAKERIKFCNLGYQKNGILRNVIDLMGDFASQGIKLEHRIPSHDRFYKAWFEKVKGKDRSERFLNLLFRQANVPIYRALGKLTINQVQDWKKAFAIKSDNLKLEETSIDSRVIPLNYSFLNIDAIEISNSAIGNFSGRKIYTLNINPQLRLDLQKLIDSKNTKEIEAIPKYIIDALSKNQNSIVLDQDKFSIYFYKKDDWEDWAEPMTYPIMDDVIMFDKLKLADLSALDGVISSVRLWNLGHIGDSPANTIIPSAAQLNRLRDLLQSGVGGGSFDLVWGPELKFQETSSEAYKFLGAQKYEPVLDTIYDGLGIPPTLRSGKVSTNANNYIAMKTLVERLNYGRDVLVSFWNNEIKIVQKAMGFAEPATVVFDHMILSDEAAEKQLLINLADRNIITDEYVRSRFDVPERIESYRIKREHKKRGKSLPHKTSPYHNSNPEHDLRKIVLQTGDVTPSEVGLELYEKKPGEVSRQERLEKSGRLQETKIKQPAGRPPNVIETKKRKKKPEVKTTANQISMAIWANDVQKTISDILLPGFLDIFQKKNVRSFTEEQFQQFEEVKAGILFELQPYEEVNNEKVYKLLLETPKTYLASKAIIENLCTKNAKILKKELTVDEKRLIYSQVYALIKENNNG